MLSSRAARVLPVLPPVPPCVLAVQLGADSSAQQCVPARVLSLVCRVATVLPFVQANRPRRLDLAMGTTLSTDRAPAHAGASRISSLAGSTAPTVTATVRDKSARST